MTTLVLVSCSGPKLAHAAAAEEIYTSDLFRLSRTWARRNGDSWAILSGKYGLLSPTAVIEPYELDLTKQTVEYRRAWAARVAQQLWPYRQHRLVLLAGREYARFNQILNSPQLEQPLARLQVGERRSWLASENERQGGRLGGLGDTGESAAFRAWFGDSKVVDDRGRPLVVYHGSSDARWFKEHGIFQTTRERILGAEDPARAYFFTDSRRVAETYADDHRAFDYQNAEPGVLSVYLSLQNPKRMSWAGQRWDGTFKAIMEAKKAGHDGVIISNVVDDYQTTKRSKPATVYVAFDPRQIKSATSNSGVWDGRNPSALAGLDGCRWCSPRVR